jgi:hypothetical protein
MQVEADPPVGGKGLDYPNSVDIVALRDTAPGRPKEAMLAILEEDEWVASAETLAKLSAKVNGYLAFVASGGLGEKYPDAAGGKVTIGLWHRGPLGDRSANAIEQARTQLESLGVTLTIRQLDEA